MNIRGSWPIRVLAALACAVATIASSQTYPQKPIRLVVPFPPGGAVDFFARTVQPALGEALGQPVVIDNKAGASGMLGPNELVSAKPDGYTLSQLTIGILRLPHMQKMQFNPLQDFTFIACLTGYTFGIVVRSDSPIKSIKDLVDYAKANPGKFTFGSTGNGTTPHLAVEEFAMKAGIQLQHIPFKGNADGMASLLGGHVMSHSDATGWAPHVDAGTCRLLATYGSKRTKRWPNVPKTPKPLGFVLKIVYV